MKFLSASLVLFLCFLVAMTRGEIPCQKEDFSGTSFVCVCNGTYCDEPDPVEALPPGLVLHVTSDRFSDRFFTETLEFDPRPPTVSVPVTLNVDVSVTYQEILGWGGSITDAAAAVIATLGDSTQDNLIRSYYDPDTGLNYNLGRVNMGGCDFSERTYTCCDTEGDVSLETFALQEEDLIYKIPVITKANTLRPEPIQLITSPWTAPPWMKSNKDYFGQGYLLPEYYSSWANYFVRFLKEYDKQGVSFWGVTAQNEPVDGNLPDFPFNCMGWNASTQSTFVADFLGPALEDAGYGDLQLMIFDDQRPLLPDWAEAAFADVIAEQYTDGFAVHWYTDDVFDPLDLPSALDRTHETFPEKFILYTEACTGTNGDDEAGFDDVELGMWERGEKYLQSIIDTLNHWVTGWIDWNMALNMEGGPNWAGNFVDAPIIVDADKDLFYKQPMFYALGHVPDLYFTAVERPDGGIVIILMNKSSDVTRFVSIVDPSQGHLDTAVFPSSWHTFVYWP